MEQISVHRGGGLEVEWSNSNWKIAGSSPTPLINVSKTLSPTLLLVVTA